MLLNTQRSRDRRHTWTPALRHPQQAAAAIRAVYDAYRAGDPGVSELNEGIASVRKCLQNHDMISALKAAMGHGWGDVAWRRVDRAGPPR